MTKRIISLCLCLLLILPFGAGCKQKNEKITVLCTLFPFYDWTREIVGRRDNIDIKLLLSDGSDIHSFQPTAKDAIGIKEADLVIRVGGVDDSFVSELMRGGGGKDLRLSEAEGVILREASVSSSHSHDGHSAHDHPTDEHIWLSLRNAAACAEAICASLSSLDPEGAEEYRKNTDEYKARLLALDKKTADEIADKGTPRGIFADRFPFVYLASDYGMEYEAAFEGCTTDAEAGFDTILRLANKLELWELSHIFVTEGSDFRLAEAVAARAEGKSISIIALNSMQAVSSDGVEGSPSYIDIMEENLNILLRKEN